MYVDVHKAEILGDLILSTVCILDGHHIVTSDLQADHISL